MEEPFGFLWVVRVPAIDHVAIIVGRSRLDLAATQHGEYGQADGLGGQSGRPLVGQNRQTDVPVAVYMRMLGYVRSDEHHTRRVERIASRKLELQAVGLSFV